jgi:lipoprotein signal peptidase
MQHNDSVSSQIVNVRGLDGHQTAAWYAAIALSVALADWVSKSLAVSYLADKTHLFGSRLALMLVFNTAGAGGMSWGPHTVQLNICLTALSVLLITGIVAQLARIDGRAAIALGLVAGGAIGNLASMALGPTGVADFMAFRFGDRAIVCNVADIALWSGALLLIPVVRSLLRAISAEKAAKHVKAAFAL